MLLEYFVFKKQRLEIGNGLVWLNTVFLHLSVSNELTKMNE